MSDYLTVGPYWPPTPHDLPEYCRAASCDHCSPPPGACPGRDPEEGEE